MKTRLLMIGEILALCILLALVIGLITYPDGDALNIILKIGSLLAAILGIL